MEYLDDHAIFLAAGLALAFLTDLGSIGLVIWGRRRVPTVTAGTWIGAVGIHVLMVAATPLGLFFGGLQAGAVFGTEKLAWLVLNAAAWPTGLLALGSAAAIAIVLWGALSPTSVDEAPARSTPNATEDSTASW